MMRTVIVLLLSSLFGLSKGYADDGPAAARSLDEEIPMSLYFAAVRATPQTGSVFPRLDYWGIGQSTWGASEEDISRDVTRASEACQLANLKCQISIGYRNEGLQRYRWNFATGIEDRRARLRLYQTLKQSLISEYGAPSEHLLPDEIVRGQDAFVQGLDDKYHVRWRGPETEVDLVLTAEQLFIEFSQAENSRASELETDYRAFEALQTTLPDSHPVHGLGRGK